MELVYKVVPSKRKKQVALKVTKDGEILVYGPKFLSKKQIEDFIMDQEPWLRKKQEEMRRYREEEARLIKEEQGFFRYLGQVYPKEIILIEKGKPYLELVEDKAVLYLKTMDQEKNITEAFYKNRGEELLEELLEKWQDRFLISPEKIKFKKQKTVWGTCNGKNNIYLNFVLLKGDFTWLEYVFVHEMCHLEIKNHSREFWEAVETHIPNYKVLKATLKDSGHRLF